MMDFMQLKPTEGLDVGGTFFTTERSYNSAEDKIES